jgi:hypothetical protein
MSGIDIWADCAFAQDRFEYNTRFYHTLKDGNKQFFQSCFNGIGLPNELGQFEDITVADIDKQLQEEIDKYLKSPP